MNEIFRPFRQFVVVYLDDILIFSKSPEEHAQHLKQVLQVLRDNSLYAKLSKCEFERAELKFLGHIVGKDGVKPDPAKIQAVADWPVPTDVPELRRFLGLATYFRKFLQGFATAAAPLTTLTGSRTPWMWGPAQQDAFDIIKRNLTHSPVLSLPDFTKPYELICDASIQGVGGVLLQDNKPIAYESRKFIPAETRYTTTEQEMAAVVHCTKVWRCYIEGCKTTLVTDHCPNTYFQTQPLLSRRQARWSEWLQQFDLTWEYRAGKLNVADPLSRHPSFQLNTLQLSDLTADIIAGYKLDPWFQVKTRLANYSVLDGLLYRKGVVVLPDHKSLRLDTMKYFHDTPFSGHIGHTKTLKQIQTRFWWPSIAKDVHHFVTTCDSCQRVKPINHKPSGLLHPMPIPSAPWLSVSMDFITDLPLSNAHTCILVFVDRLTKMVRLAPCVKTCSSADVADLFINHVFRHHGMPAGRLHRCSCCI
jgi:hypothetical protein